MCIRNISIFMLGNPKRVHFLLVLKCSRELELKKRAKKGLGAIQKGFH